jgi:hypothetical protein
MTVNLVYREIKKGKKEKGKGGGKMKIVTRARGRRGKESKELQVLFRHTVRPRST